MRVRYLALYAYIIIVISTTYVSCVFHAGSYLYNTHKNTEFSFQIYHSIYIHTYKRQSFCSKRNIMERKLDRLPLRSRTRITPRAGGLIRGAIQSELAPWSRSPVQARYYSEIARVCETNQCRWGRRRWRRWYDGSKSFERNAVLLQGRVVHCHSFGRRGVRCRW
jgi:hypothetical protein